jgi:membrane-bound lytic murein transglycosylase
MVLQLTRRDPGRRVYSMQLADFVVDDAQPGEALDRMAQQQPDHAATTAQETGSADSRHQTAAQRAEAVAGTAHRAAPRSAHDVAAQREQDARQPAMAQANNSARMQANRAAVAANEAYRAGTWTVQGS